jgi:hypothetical protein
MLPEDSMTMSKWTVRLMLVFLVGCSNPYKEPLPADLKTIDQDKSFQAAVQKLPEDDRKLLAGYLVRVTLAEGFGAKVDRAKSVGEGIEAQRAWLADQAKKEAEAKALAAKVEAARAAAEKSMSDALTVAVLSKKFVPSDVWAHRYEDLIELRVAFENKSGKEMKGVKGSLEFRDMFGDEIKTTRLAVDETIPAGKTYVWEGSMKRNQFDHSAVQLAAAPLEKLKVRWLPDVYLFTDGSEARMPSAKD